MPRLRHIPPYDYRFRFDVTPEFFGVSVLDFFERRFHFKPRAYWEERIRAGDVSVNEEATTIERVLLKDDVVHTVRHDVTEPPVNDTIDILSDEAGLIILNKQAPIPVHPSGRYFKNSLTSILREKFPERSLHTIHRLDLWTTGILLIATDPRVAKILHTQINKRTMKKTYGVLAVGNFGEAPFIIDVPIGRVNGPRRGFGDGVIKPRECVTRFTPLLTKPHGETQITFLKAELLTGRTNQIRVHVQAAGGFVLHDPIYSPQPPQDDEMEFMGLHCREMEFKLVDEVPVIATAPWPNGFCEIFSRVELDRSFV